MGVWCGALQQPGVHRMRFLLPDSIAGRTMVVLVVGLTLSHVASMALISVEAQDAHIAGDATACLVRIASAARQIAEAPAGERPRLAQTLSDAGLEVSWGWERGASADLVLPLVDGSAAGFRAGPPQHPPSLWSPHMVVSTLVMVAAIVGLGAWATTWVGRPLAAFAQAADRLGRHVSGPPLPGGGPREVRRAVAAFNQMQERIRRFVEDRTRMVAAISHDLRSPVTRMRLRVEMLPEGEARERMLADLGEMETMVSSVLEFARGEATDELSQTVDLAAMLETVCDDASDLGLAADYAWESRLVCTCRPASLKRAFANLIENAARYGGRAAVRAGRLDGDIEVVIEDDGPGIPEAEMKKVFTPFYRLEGSRNRRTGGIGLGMTVARTIVHAHGGDIRLENREGGGLRVTVTIPQGAAVA